MKIPFAAYFAGIGTVVAALAVGFGGALFLTSTPDVKKEGPAFATKVERPKAEEPKPVPQEEPQAQAATPAAAPAPAVASSNPNEWVAVPPAQTSAAPVIPLTAPLSPPAVETSGAASAAAPPVERPVPSTAKVAEDKKRKAADQNAKRSTSSQARTAEPDDDAAPDNAAASGTVSELPGMKTIGAVSGNSH